MLPQLTTNPLIRSIARRIGLLRLLRNLLPSPDHYEERFSKVMLGAIRAKDCVWDVGANTGYYTKRFSSLVGLGGSVHAFEPFSATHEKLLANLQAAGCTNVRAHRLALGQTDEDIVVPASNEAGGETNSLVGPSTTATTTEKITVRFGDGLIACGFPVPNVLKIDVEAFEGEVLDGLSGTLARPECRAIFCEVHFAKLEARGLRHAPRRIEELCRAAGFRIEWIDASHIGAYRNVP